ncbi:uncharacterized protein LOC126047087 isoform X2 [Accipiter gentilis]|uniref:uncharacterized protein LOC126047087 isoform X2 n=1 Tax=Astur gentilis TaxID=8957 RepID=UPI00210F2B56|nr:uncharacterized protein LOC126047087 isoform X2 [Accipiter gentilis]
MPGLDFPVAPGSLTDLPPGGTQWLVPTCLRPGVCSTDSPCSRSPGKRLLGAGRTKALDSVLRWDPIRALPSLMSLNSLRSSGSYHVTCAHQYPTGKASVADLYWAPARQEALAHHLLLLRMLQALGNPLSCSGTEQAEPNPTSELGAASSPHCRQDESAYLGMGSPS